MGHFSVEMINLEFGRSYTLYDCLKAVKICHKNLGREMRSFGLLKTSGMAHKDFLDDNNKKVSFNILTMVYTKSVVNWLTQKTTYAATATANCIF